MASSNAVTKQIHVTVQSATLYLGVHRQKKLQYKRFCIFFVSFFPTFIKTSSTRIWISLKLHFFCTNWPFTHTKPFKLLTETTYFDTDLQNGLIHTIFGEKNNMQLQKCLDWCGQGLIHHNKQARSYHIK